MNKILPLLLSLLVLLSDVCLAQEDTAATRTPVAPTLQSDTTIRKPVIRRRPDSTHIVRAAADSLAIADSILLATDTVHYAVTNDSLKPRKPQPVVVDFPRSRLTWVGMLRLHPYYNFFAPPIVRVSIEHHTEGKETLFYLLAG
ncbi:MAG: hypothetical protein JST39_25105, partial [Bacteroidetes bacterium]|nr:hypothetical protein [Bacteroidota bacterium]